MTSSISSIRLFSNCKTGTFSRVDGGMTKLVNSPSTLRQTVSLGCRGIGMCGTSTRRPSALQIQLIRVTSSDSGRAFLLRIACAETRRERTVKDSNSRVSRRITSSSSYLGSMRTKPRAYFKNLPCSVTTFPRPLTSSRPPVSQIPSDSNNFARGKVITCRCTVEEISLLKRSRHGKSQTLGVPHSSQSET